MEVGGELVTAFSATVLFNAGAFWGVALFYRKVTNGRLKRDEEELREHKRATTEELKEIRKEIADDVGKIKDGVTEIRLKVARIESHCETMDCLRGETAPEREGP